MSSEQSNVSVVVSCHNQGVNLTRILPRLNHQTLKPREIIIADNNSTEPIEYLSKKLGCKYVQTPKNELKKQSIATRSLTRQIGALAATGNLILFIDGDIVPSPYIIELTSVYHAKYKDPIIVKTPRRFRIRLDKQLMPNGPLPNFSKISEDRISFEDFTSDCFSIAKNDLTDIGGWDSKFVGWGEEDVELAYRCYKAGIPIIVPKHPAFYSTHIDHPINHHANFRSLSKNANYFVQKHPEIKSIRAHLWSSIGVYLSSYGKSTGRI